MPEGACCAISPRSLKDVMQDFGQLWQHLMPFIVVCWRQCFAVHCNIPSSGW